MMPGGHLATAIGLSGAAYWATSSVELAAGCFGGGFLIDVDHYLDYLLFEGQWRRPSPTDFLRYYFKCLPRRLVLPLHSLELMTGLTILASLWPQPLLLGYLAGAIMHLAFDVAINGDHALRRPVLFYFFAYRAVHRFQAGMLLDDIKLAPESGFHPYRDFFKWRPLTRKMPPAD